MTTSDKALVFDLKRFAVHDGAGIRTTVFFKGCPLSCPWCQNPEGMNPNRHLVCVTSNCIGCQTCVKTSQGEITFEQEPHIHGERHADAVIRCCPGGAMRYDSEWYDLDSLMERLRADKVFYREDGGVTFSGGEPLLHADFLEPLIHRCHTEGIKCAIETTAYAPDYVTDTIFPLLDELFIDFKIFDDKAHKQVIGVSNTLIRKHIEKALKSEGAERITIRTPLVEGLTATKDNIQAIAQTLASWNPDVHYELLNYNPLAPAKYPLARKTYTLDGVKPLSDEALAGLKSVCLDAGLSNVTTS